MTQPGSAAPDPVPLPLPIVWADLDADDYRTQLTDLAGWVRWLVDTYRPPESIIPPCWHHHPDLREELTHLWLGWRQAHHPQMGLGRTGMDWDTARDGCYARMRTMLAGTCSTTKGHVPPSSPTQPPGAAADFAAHLADEHSRRRSAGLRHARAAAAQERLDTAEAAAGAAVDQRLAAEPDPAAPSDQARTDAEQAVAAALHQLAAAAAAATDIAGRALGAEDRRLDAQHTLQAAAAALVDHLAENAPDPGVTDTLTTQWVLAHHDTIDPAVIVRRSIAAARRAAQAAARPDTDPQPPPVYPPA